jgi:hypothetical protein
MEHEDNIVFKELNYKSGIDYVIGTLKRYFTFYVLFLGLYMYNLPL